jgi:hypothetical protein
VCASTLAVAIACKPPASSDNKGVNAINTGKAGAGDALRMSAGGCGPKDGDDKQRLTAALPETSLFSGEYAALAPRAIAAKVRLEDSSFETSCRAACEAMAGDLQKRCVENISKINSCFVPSGSDFSIIIRDKKEIVHGAMIPSVFDAWLKMVETSSLTLTPPGQAPVQFSAIVRLTMGKASAIMLQQLQAQTQKVKSKEGKEIEENVGLGRVMAIAENVALPGADAETKAAIEAVIKKADAALIVQQIAPIPAVQNFLFAEMFDSYYCNKATDDEFVKVFSETHKYFAEQVAPLFGKQWWESK